MKYNDSQKPNTANSIVNFFFKNDVVYIYFQHLFADFIPV